MSLLRHGCRRNSFWNSQTNSQMCTFPYQMYCKLVQILIASKFHSKLREQDTDHVKQKTSLFSVHGKSAWIYFKAFVLLFWVICVRYTKYARTPITTILATHLLHEFIVNVEHRMDWSYRKSYVCLSFNF